MSRGRAARGRCRSRTTWHSRPATGVKHEYVLGQVYALAGASEDHNRIAVNIAAAVLPAARAVGCRVLGSNQKLQPGNDLYYYPDGPGAA